ncbi:hypothetical protein SAMN05446635_6767 [Burkholderia sp. OK233]|nr:hypothetical protein SAMN05446635_6767 [Burkholderia sp. OK233]
MNRRSSVDCENDEVVGPNANGARARQTPRADKRRALSELRASLYGACVSLERVVGLCGARVGVQNLQLLDVHVLQAVARSQAPMSFADIRRAALDHEAHLVVYSVKKLCKSLLLQKTGARRKATYHLMPHSGILFGAIDATDSLLHERLDLALGQRIATMRAAREFLVELGGRCDEVARTLCVE